jgi:nitrogen PTS system EIIA component
MDTDILTVDEVAELLRVSSRTVYKWAQQGEIPGGKFGATWRFSREQVDEWIADRLQQQTVLPNPVVAKDLAAAWDEADTLLLDESETDKAQVIERLIRRLETRGALPDPTAFREAIRHREELMSTGIGGGVGVPHARLIGIDEVRVAAACSPLPIADYEAIDGAPVQMVFLIMAGAGQHQQHIRLLSDIARIVKDADLRQVLLASRTPMEFHRRLTTG